MWQTPSAPALRGHERRVAELLDRGGRGEAFAQTDSGEEAAPLSE